MIINSQTFILEDKEEVIISDGYGIIPVHDMERYLGQGSMNRPSSRFRPGRSIGNPTKANHNDSIDLPLCFVMVSFD